MKIFLFLLALAAAPSFAAEPPPPATLVGAEFWARGNVMYTRWVPDRASYPTCYYMSEVAYRLMIAAERDKPKQSGLALIAKYQNWVPCATDKNPDVFTSDPISVRQERAFNAQCRIPLTALEARECESGAVVWRWNVKPNGIYTSRPAKNLDVFLRTGVLQDDGRVNIKNPDGTRTPCGEKPYEVGTTTKINYGIVKNIAGKEALAVCDSSKVTLP